MLNTRYSCHISRKLEFSRQSFEKYSNIILHENPSSGNRNVPCGQTDRQTTRSLIVHFGNFAKEPKNIVRMTNE
jgi:hypothetical protein